MFACVTTSVSIYRVRYRRNQIQCVATPARRFVVYKTSSNRICWVFYAAALYLSIWWECDAEVGGNVFYIGIFERFVVRRVTILYTTHIHTTSYVYDFKMISFNIQYIRSHEFCLMARVVRNVQPKPYYIPRTRCFIIFQKSRHQSLQAST